MAAYLSPAPRSGKSVACGLSVADFEASVATQPCIDDSRVLAKMRRLQNPAEGSSLKTALRAAFAAAAILASTASAFAARTDVVVGMQLEPPNLDPTGGAAAAIREVVYANVFESLTRIAQDGSVIPGLARSWDIS